MIETSFDPLLENLEKCEDDVSTFDCREIVLKWREVIKLWPDREKMRVKMESYGTPRQRAEEVLVSFREPRDLVDYVRRILIFYYPELKGRI